MKTTFSSLYAALVVALLLLAAPQAQAQTKNTMRVAKIENGYLKKDGCVYQYVNGQPTKLKKAVVLENGTKVKRNGVCILPDKSKFKMQNGNCIDKNGKLGDCTVKENETL